MKFLITVHYKSRKTIGTDGFETFAIEEHPVDWLARALSTHTEKDSYYEKPRIVLAMEISEEQFNTIKKLL